MKGKAQRMYMPRIKVFVSVAVIAIIIVIAVRMFTVFNDVVSLTGLSPGVMARLLFDKGAWLMQTDGRTNVLVLGIGGANHEGSDLTDTMLIVSLDGTGRNMSLLSIPRDIWSDTLKDRINSAYHYGEEKKAGGGMTLAKVITEDIVGIPIHYSLLVDFSGFRQIINILGGIDVTVTNGFTDTDYPIEGKEDDECNGDTEFRCRYETISFVTGIQHMEGDTALKYVRSRHAEGDQGSDFARGGRQQEVLVALKEKLVQPSSWSSIKQDIAFIQAVDQATTMDMTIGELLTIGKMVTQVTGEHIRRISLDALFVNPPQYLFGGRYVLVPVESYEAVHTYIKNELSL